MRESAAILCRMAQADGFVRCLEALRRGESATLAGLAGSSRALALLLLRRALDRPLLVVGAEDRETALLRRDLEALAQALAPEAACPILALPAHEADPRAGIETHPRTASERVAALGAARSGAPVILVVSLAALAQPLPPREHLDAGFFALRPGAELSPEDLLARLEAAGYARLEAAAEPGEAARRGGVVDFFSPLAEAPWRLEFEGDRLASLREFDPGTQRSLHPVEEARVAPVREWRPDREALARLERALAGLDRQVPHPRRREWMHRLRGEGRLAGLEAFAGMVFERPATLFDYAPGALAVVDEPAAVLEALHAGLEDPRTGTEAMLAPPRWEGSEIEARLRRPSLSLSELGLGELLGAGPTCWIEHRSAVSFRGRPADLAREVQAEARQGRSVLFLMASPGSADRARELLAEYEAAGMASVDVAPLRHGFSLPEAGVTVLAEAEVFGEEPAARPRPRKAAAFRGSDFRDLRPGDYLVHVEHGIGRYEGLARLAGRETEGDFMVLEYRERARLYLPLDRLDLVERYSGSGQEKPRLDSLGGASWTRVKKRVRGELREIAVDLLQLYASRKVSPGHAFGADTPWQREFESAFPYTETTDQDTAIQDVKKDMETPAPMDRLVCGDVGFGKTEVAMRAAFKAVMDQRQVAVLAPTTVLAFQHLNTFRQRFAPFPVRVEMLSRLRPARERGQVVRDLSAGQVDIVIGTHRLLSSDVRIPRLGLLVIDEEQRFGVSDKEKLKRLARGVDVLSLTATPIPRTLQMSLAGIRDLSLIQTSPESRLAIQTAVLPFSEELVRAAIAQELRRGGQVYFVHNRVESIYTVAALVQRLAGEAKVDVAHGQMREAQLEKTMLRFLSGTFDVLVSTTIIENGLDLPRVNTLIVNRADAFGLAQLYQLRGRIGRSDRRAYAYLLVPPEGELTPLARRRLRTLKEFSELGSGFRIAARDLELRGAGELLGPRQHGHIAALGFDLYCRMLEQAVEEVRSGAAPPPEVSTTMSLGLDIQIPEDFILEPHERLQVCKQIASARDDAELGALRAELEDRYGRLPPQAENLLSLASLRLLAARLRVVSVERRAGRIAIALSPDSPIEAGRLASWVQGVPQARLTPAGVLQLPAPGGGEAITAAVRGVLQALA
jgi:transcription-repair coupling factor (superfamily II helicase)